MKLFNFTKKMNVKTFLGTLALIGLSVSSLMAQTLLEEVQRDVIRYVYEYDNQNRIMKRSDYNNVGPYCVNTFNYNANGDLIELKKENPNNPADFSLVTFSKSGDKITIVEEGSPLEEIELNLQGLIVKHTTLNDNGDGNWCKNISIFIWQNNNITKEELVFQWKEGEDEDSTSYRTITYTHDDKKSPFYHCNTPKWFLRWWQYERDYCSENNIKTEEWEGDESVFETYEYIYNSDGFPETRIAWEKTVTYKYIKRYSITATAGTNGTITPNGEVIVTKGEDQTFTFSANSGYEIDQVLIDGTNDTAAVTAGTYTFENVTADHTISVSFKKTTGIAEITNDQFRLYPNPTDGKLLIESGNLCVEKVEIYDIHGRNVLSRTPHLSPETIIDISHLPSGTYFVKLKTATEELSKKVIKE